MEVLSSLEAVVERVSLLGGSILSRVWTRAESEAVEAAVCLAHSEVLFFTQLEVEEVEEVEVVS